MQALRFVVGSGNCPMISKYGLSLSKSVGPVDPSFLVVKKSHFNKAGSLSHDFKIWPITFQGSGPSGPIFFSCVKSHFNKNIHLTASLRTPQNRKYM